VQLGVFGDLGLDENRGLVRIDSNRQPVDHHLESELGDLPRVFIMRGQRMPVGGEEQAFGLLLKLQPVFQHAVVVAQVQRAGGAHARNHAASGGKLIVHKRSMGSAIQRYGMSMANYTRLRVGSCVDITATKVAGRPRARRC